MARLSTMESHPSQLRKAHIHILKTSLAENGECVEIASQPSQPAKAHIHILKTSLAKMARARKSQEKRLHI